MLHDGVPVDGKTMADRRNEKRFLQLHMACRDAGNAPANRVPEPPATSPKWYSG